MADAHEVIQLELRRAIDLFDTPATELGADFGGSIAGVDRCIAELTAHPIGSAVRLDIVVPDSELAPDLGERIGTSLQRWCDEHRHQNDLLRRSMQRSGLRALGLGLPVSLLGLAIVGVASAIGSHDPLHDVVDIVGWVFAWLGLWYPFDKILFYPQDLERENRALGVLHDATVTVSARPAEPSHQP